MASERCTGSIGGARCKRRRYTSWPQQLGQMNFDLNNGLNETPYQNSNKRKNREQTKTGETSTGFTQDELVSMSSDQHAELVTTELDTILENWASASAVLVDRPRHPIITQFGPSYVNVDVNRLPRGSKRRKESVDLSETLSTAPSRLTSSPPWIFERRDVSDDNRFQQPESPKDVDVPSQNQSDFSESNSSEDPQLLRDLETRAITVPQLIQEVKGIYAGLVMVEKKSIEIVNQQAQAPTKLSKEQWEALIALHRTLLNEHHDLVTATHHPEVRHHELREVAARYAMPARMYRYAMHAFLELFRHHCREDPAYMHSVLDTSFGMLNRLENEVPDMANDWSEIARNLHCYVAVLRRLEVDIPETEAEIFSRKKHVSSHFMDIWIEHLVDLARYRMATEEADHRDREVWSNSTRMWFDQAADLSPNTGRIQHHLAVLAGYSIENSLHFNDDPCDESNGECRSFPPLPTPPPSEPEGTSDILQHFRSNDRLWLLMAGWLRLGQRISRNFRAFYKLFTFLPWAAASLN